MSSKYSIELWTAGGQLLADLSGRAKNRQVVKSRNESDDIEWELDLNDFESYCRKTNQDPKSLLIVGQTEVRVKRKGTYIAGGQLDYFDPQVDAQSQVIQLKASGFLDLFKYRYTGTERIFTATEATTIASTLITESQTAETYSDFGVTIGAMATVGNHDRTYQRTNLKDALQNLTKVQTNPFDFEFTADKVFKTYAAIGSNRPDVIFEYPGNIISFDAPVDGTQLANKVIALGAGFGDQAQAQDIEENTASQATYKVREKIITTSATDNTDNGLTDNAVAELAAWAFPFQIPSLVVNGNVAPFIGDYGIGDYIRVNLKNYALLSDIDGMYRLEKYTLNLDDDDNERITLEVSV